jgi:hypothetical protein
MANQRQSINLDLLSTEELNELLNDVMVKLRHRDAQEIQKSMVRESQRLTLPENIARHLAAQKEKPKSL